MLRRHNTGKKTPDHYPLPPPEKIRKAPGAATEPLPRGTAGTSAESSEGKVRVGGDGRGDGTDGGRFLRANGKDAGGVSGVKCQESSVRSQESGVRSQESGVRSQESGVGG